MIAPILLAWMAGAGALSVDAFLDDFGARREHILALRAKYDQETITPDETLRSEGTMIYVKPQRIVFRSESEGTAFVIDALKAYDYDALLEQMEIFDLQDQPEAQALFLGFSSDSGRLKEAYDIAFFDPSDVEGADKGLVLRPKASEPGPPLFEQVRLWLRANDYLLVEILIVYDADSQVRIRLADLEVNPTDPPIDPVQTQISLPPGTVVLDSDNTTFDVGEDGLRIPEAVGVAVPPKAEEESPLP